MSGIAVVSASNVSATSNARAVKPTVVASRNPPLGLLASQFAKSQTPLHFGGGNESGYEALRTESTVWSGDESGYAIVLDAQSDPAQPSVISSSDPSFESNAPGTALLIASAGPQAPMSPAADSNVLSSPSAANSLVDAAELVRLHQAAASFSLAWNAPAVARFESEYASHLSPNDTATTLIAASLSSSTGQALSRAYGADAQFDASRLHRWDEWVSEGESGYRKVEHAGYRLAGDWYILTDETKGLIVTRASASGNRIEAMAANPFRIELPAQVAAGYGRSLAPEGSSLIESAPASDPFELAAIDLLLTDTSVAELIDRLATAPVVIDSPGAFLLVERFGLARVARLSQWQQATQAVREHFEQAIGAAAASPHGPGWHDVPVEHRHSDESGVTVTTTLEPRFDPLAFAQHFASGEGLFERGFALLFAGQASSRQVGTAGDEGHRESPRTQLLLSDGAWIFDPAIGHLQRTDSLSDIDLNTDALFDPRAIGFDPAAGWVTSAGNIPPVDSDFDFYFDAAVTVVTAYIASQTGYAVASELGMASAGTLSSGGAVVAGAVSSSFSSLFNGIAGDSFSLRTVFESVITGALTASIAQIELGDGMRLGSLGINGRETDWALRGISLAGQATLRGALTEVLGGHFSDGFRQAALQFISGEFVRQSEARIAAERLTGADSTAARGAARLISNVIRVAGSSEPSMQAVAQAWLGEALQQLPVQTPGAEQRLETLGSLAERLTAERASEPHINDVDHFNDAQIALYDRLVGEGNAPEEARRFVFLIEDLVADPRFGEYYGYGSLGPADLARQLKPGNLGERASTGYDTAQAEMLRMGATAETARSVAYEVSLMTETAAIIDRIDSRSAVGPPQDMTPQLAAERQRMVMALVSQDVYFDRSIAPMLPASVVRLSEAEVVALGIQPQLLEHARSGFFAAVYRDTANGQIVVANRGTELSIPDRVQADMFTNAIQAVGLRSGQYTAAMNLGFEFLIKLPSENITFTGHSLGGGLASAQSSISGFGAVSFNAAGLHPTTIAREGVRDFSTATSNISAFYVRGEFVSALQDRSMAWVQIVQRIAERNPWVRAFSLVGSILEFGPPAAGVRTSIAALDQASWQTVLSDSTARIDGASMPISDAVMQLNPIEAFEQHGINRVINSLRQSLLLEMLRPPSNRL